MTKTQLLLPMILVRNQITNMLGEEISNYIWKNSVQIWVQAKKNTSLYTLYWYNAEGADLNVTDVKVMTVFVTRKDSVYTKGCGLNPTVTHSVQKHPLKLSTYTNRTAVYA